MHDKTTPKPLTEKWQNRFEELCNIFASWSKDPSSKVGALIVDDDCRFISAGYNGFPKHIPDTEEMLNNREMKYKHVIHAEQNAINNAEPERLVGSTLFVTHYPCPKCSEEIIKNKIKTVVVLRYNRSYETRWSEMLSESRKMLKKANVEIIRKETYHE